MEHTIEALSERLNLNLNDKQSGRVLCAVESVPSNNGQSDDDRICDFLSSRGLSLSPGVLKPLARSDAMFVAIELLWGPVWGPRPEDRVVGERAASYFMSQFHETSRLFSTYIFKINWDNLTYSAEGSRLLGNDFETGFFIVDSEHVGVLWVGDDH